MQQATSTVSIFLLGYNYAKSKNIQNGSLFAVIKMFYTNSRYREIPDLVNPYLIIRSGNKCPQSPQLITREYQDFTDTNNESTFAAKAQINQFTAKADEIKTPSAYQISFIKYHHSFDKAKQTTNKCWFVQFLADKQDQNKKSH